MALGVTWTMPVEDRYGMTRDQLLAQIRHAMGGRAAEDVVFGQFSTGAANDLKQATEQARRMVCSYGMSDRIGPMSFADDDHDVFLGRDFVQRKDYSEKKAQEIDEEVSELLRGLYTQARQLLEEHRDVLDRISLALLERETLESDELKLLVEGKPLPELPRPVSTSKSDQHPPRERAPAGAPGGFRGDKLPDPEPVPG
jgi:cell division protease FtsH